MKDVYVRGPGHMVRCLIELVQISRDPISTTRRWTQ